MLQNVYNTQEHKTNGVTRMEHERPIVNYARKTLETTVMQNEKEDALQYYTKKCQDPDFRNKQNERRKELYR